MKTIIEKTELFKTDDNDLSVHLQRKILTDDSEAFNVIITLFDIHQNNITTLEDHNCCDLTEAKDKYLDVVQALTGFELA